MFTSELSPFIGRHLYQSKKQNKTLDIPKLALTEHKSNSGGLIFRKCTVLQILQKSIMFTCGPLVQNKINTHVIILNVVSSRNVSAEKVLDLRNVHGLFDGGVSTADRKEAALQCVFTDRHGEKHPHLIIPKAQGHRSEEWLGELLSHLSQH